MVQVFEEIDGTQRQSSLARRSPGIPVLDAPLNQSLARLLLCSRIRELAGYVMVPVRISDLRGLRWLVAPLVRRLYTGRGPSNQRRGFWLGWRMLLDLWAIVFLRTLLLLRRGRIGEDLRTTVAVLCRAVLYRGLRYYACPVAEMTAHVACTETERPLIRSSLLLRTLRRYGSCVEVLCQRLRSGRPDWQTRKWLSFHLREIGDHEAAEQLVPSEPMQIRERAIGAERLAELRVTKAVSCRLKYGLVVMTMSDSKVFRSSLTSLVNSDFPGAIVVAEDGYQPTRSCEAFCQDQSVRYVKNPHWTGAQAVTALGIQQLDPDTDVIIQVCNDILWPRQWFAQLDEAWERVSDTGKVDMLLMSYLQFDGSTEPVLRELFLNGCYEDLLWVLKTRLQVQPGLEWYKEAQNHNVGQLFGFPKDMYVEDAGKLRFKMGYGAAATTFPRTAWEAVASPPSGMSFGLEMELAYQAWQRRKWVLSVNTTPQIHMIGQDTGQLRGQDKHRWREMFRRDFERFEQKYGWRWEHVHWCFSAETSLIYYDEILSAVNDLRFEDVDFIFEDFAERVSRKRPSCANPFLPRD